MARSTEDSRFEVTAEFAARALFVLFMLGLGLLFMRLSTLWILMFGAVVVAVVIRTLADPLRRRTPLNEPLSIAAALGVIVILLGLIGWFFGAEVTRQVNQIIDRLPAAWATVQAEFLNTPLGARVLEQTRELSGQVGQALALAPRIASSVLGSTANLFLVIVAGVMLSVRPSAYRDGLLLLVPLGPRAKVKDALDASGEALKKWLLGTFISMLIIGLLTGVGLWLVGVPSPLALGLFSGLAQFVPIVGPIVSTIPGLLIAATEGWHTVALALAVYVAVQQIESNFITPMVQKHMASIPMVLTLFAVLGFGMLFGVLGVLFATPMAVVAYVFVKMLYVREALGKEVEVPGDSEPAEG